MAMDTVTIAPASTDDRQVKRRAACDECSTALTWNQLRHISSSDGRVEEAQMLRRTACMFAMPAREHKMHILTAKADGTTEETTTS